MELHAQGEPQVLTSNGEFVLEMELVLDPGVVPLDIDQLIVPRASFGGQAVLLVRVEALSSGAPAFPVQGVAQQTRVSLRIHTTRAPRSGDWFLLHFILAKGNRLALRGQLSGGPRFSVSFFALEADRKRFLIGLVGCFAIVVALHSWGAQISRGWLEGQVSLPDLAKSLLIALLGAVALPSLFSLDELVALIARPETKVSPPLFFWLSRRWWIAVAWSAAASLAVGGTLIGAYHLPDIGSDKLAWYRKADGRPVEKGETFSRFEVPGLVIAVKSRVEEKTLVPLGRLDIDPWKQLILHTKDVGRERIQMKQWAVEAAGSAMSVLKRNCTASDVLDLAGRRVSPIVLLESKCLKKLQVDVAGLLGGEPGSRIASAEPALEWSVQTDERIHVDNPESLEAGDVTAVVTGWISSGDFKNADAKTAASPGGTFAAPVLPEYLMKHSVEPDSYRSGLRELLDRWEVAPGGKNRSYLYRNAIRVYLVGLLFDFCDERWSDGQFHRDQAFRDTLNQLQARLFVPADRGSFPTTSTSKEALEHFYGFLIRQGLKNDVVMPKVLAVAKDSGRISNAALLSAVVASGVLEALAERKAGPGKNFRDELVGRFSRYTRFKEFAELVDHLLLDAPVGPTRALLEAVALGPLPAGDRIDDSRLGAAPVPENLQVAGIREEAEGH